MSCGGVGCGGVAPGTGPPAIFVPDAAGPDAAVRDAAVRDAAVLDAVILAGGRASRLGGASKPDVRVGGRRLLERVLAATVAAGVRRTVVVGPSGLVAPPVLSALEDPPFGGPVAGIAAGLAALAPGGPAQRADLAASSSPSAAAFPPAPTSGTSPTPGPSPASQWTSGDLELQGPLTRRELPNSAPATEAVLLLACDLPFARDAVGPLLRAFAPLPADVDGACLLDRDGRPQWLVGVYRRTALEGALAELGGVRGAPVRALAGHLRLVGVPDAGSGTVDVDTWEDLTRAETIRAGTDRTGTDRAEPDPPEENR